MGTGGRGASSGRGEVPSPARAGRRADATLVAPPRAPERDTATTERGAGAWTRRLSGRLVDELSGAPVPLQAIGLLEAFTCVVASDHVPHGKPEPDVYLAAAARLGVDPAGSLAIEDSPTGMQAALRAGMTCFVVPNGEMQGADFTGAHGQFTSLTAVRKALSLDGGAAA